MMALESESIKIVQNVKVEIINPWMASSIFEFQFFCCPECDEKSQDKQDFVNHATYHTGVSYSGARLRIIKTPFLINWPFSRRPYRC